MSRIWFVVWAIIIWQVAAWAFAPEPKARQAAPMDGPGYGTNEKYSVDGRARQRESDIANNVFGPHYLKRLNVQRDL